MERDLQYASLQARMQFRFDGLLRKAGLIRKLCAIDVVGPGEDIILLDARHRLWLLKPNDLVRGVRRAPACSESIKSQPG